MKRASHPTRKFSGNGGGRKNGATKPSANAPVFKHPKTELEAAIQRYVDLFELAPMAYVSFDRVGRIEEINLAAAQLLGGSRDQLIGEPFALRVTKDDGMLFLNHLLRCRSSDRRVETELHLKKRNGDVVLTRMESSPMTSSMRDGALLYQTAIVDLTERKRAEEAIRQSEERYRALFNLGPMAVYTVDTSGVIKEYNRQAAELWGREPAFGDTDQRFCGSFKMFRPDGSLMPHDQCPMAEVVSGKISVVHDGEVLIKRPDGSHVTVLVNIRPLKNDRGEVTGAINCFYDITERKQTEEQLAEQARLLDLTNDAIIVRDHQDRVVYWNRGAEEMYGFSAKEALGKITHELLQTAHPGNFKKIRKKLKRDNRWSGELVHARKDGTQVVVISRWSLDRDASGKPMSILETNTDITARKRAEVELQRAKDTLERMVEQRTRELRIANTGLKNEIERRKGLEGEILTVSDREQQRLGQELHDGLCQHLTAVAFMSRSIAMRLKNHRVIEVGDIEKIAQLVNDAATDTRNLSRALHRLDVDAAGLVDALQDLVDREIWRTPCRLEIKPSFRIEDDAAAAHLYRIAREAVINANKHARAREIMVRLQRSRREIVLQVIDDGVGLSEERKLKQGLGLHIMNYRAQLAGGRLEIESRKTGGTLVSCYLPVHAPRLKKAPNGDEPIGATQENPAGPVAGDRTL